MTSLIIIWLIVGFVGAWFSIAQDGWFSGKFTIDDLLITILLCCLLSILGPIFFIRILWIKLKIGDVVIMNIPEKEDKDKKTIFPAPW